jgi:hypothetical protein
VSTLPFVGCGIAGMAAAIFGAEVTFTDMSNVLDHLKFNVQSNISSTTANTSNNHEVIRCR